MEAMDESYHLNHRNGEIGNYIFTMTGEKKAIMKCNIPYPCFFDLGLLEGFMCRFKQDGDNPCVVHVKGNCRRDGSEFCEYELTW